MSDSEKMGRCRSEVDECRGSPSELKIASAIDRLAADVASVKAKVDAVSPEDVKHFVEAEKAWVAHVTEQRDEAIRKLDEARAEVERLKAELAARQADGNSPTTSDSSPAAPQPAGQGISPKVADTQPPRNAAPAAGGLTDSERRAVAYFADVCRDDLVPDEWTVNAGVLRSLLSRAGSPPVVEVPAMVFGSGSYGVQKRYRAAMDKAGVKWKEVGRE